MRNWVLHLIMTVCLVSAAFNGYLWRRADVLDQQLVRYRTTDETLSARLEVLYRDFSKHASHEVTARSSQHDELLSLTRRVDALAAALSAVNATLNRHDDRLTELAAESAPKSALAKLQEQATDPRSISQSPDQLQRTIRDLQLKLRALEAAIATPSSGN